MAMRTVEAIFNKIFCFVGLHVWAQLYDWYRGFYTCANCGKLKHNGITRLSSPRRK